MKKKMAVLVLGAFLVTGLFGCGNKVPEGTVATVNGEPISQEELDSNYGQMLQMYQYYYGIDVSDDSLRKNVRNDMLNSLIMQELLLQEAEKKGLSVSEEELAERIDGMVEQYGSEEDLAAAVEGAGMTMDYFKQVQQEQMVLEKIQEDMVNNPEPADVIQARHILITNEVENAEQVATDLIAQLDNGADFATLAQENSKDTGSAANGGELGYFSVGNGSTIPQMMVDEFTAGAQALEIGEYSKTPVQSDYGYHIILVEDKQSGVNLLDDSEKYANILSSIYSNGLNTLADNLYKAADEKGKIKILIDTESVPALPEDSGQDASNDDANTGDDADANGETGADGAGDEAGADGADNGEADAQ